MSGHRVFFIEVNRNNGLRSRIRVDKIVEIIDDYQGDGARATAKRPFVKVILEGGANVSIEGETYGQFWERYTAAVQVPLQCIDAPDVDSTDV
jgi:hypothetical protein